MKTYFRSVDISKVILISSLYISQSVPVSFLKTGFQVYLERTGHDLTTIGGLMGLMLLPWLLKFLWAPLVDRYGNNRIGHRKSWIIPTQIMGSLLLLAIAFTDIDAQLKLVVLLFFAYSLICATQDIAVDGLAVLTLTRREHGIGNSMQMGGYYLGELLGGAVILIVLGLYGWTWSMLALAGFFLLPLIPLLRYKEATCPVAVDDRPRFSSIGQYFRGEDKVWIWVLILYMGNQVLARTLLPSLLSKLDYSEVAIGSIIAIFGNTAAVAGAVLGGIWMNKFGRKRSLIAYGLLKIVAFSTLFLLLDSSSPRAVVYAVVMFNDFAAGLATAALFTVMMDKCSLNHPGTDFTIQQSVNQVGIIFFAILGGRLADKIGFGGLFTSAIVLGIISVLLVWKGMRWKGIELSSEKPVNPEGTL